MREDDQDVLERHDGDLEDVCQRRREQSVDQPQVDYEVYVVEPRGFDPLTSAMQSRGTAIVDVRRRSKLPAIPRFFL